MKTPQALRRIESQMATLDPGSLRHHALSAARDFKTSWISLGRALASVWNDRAYKSWGYLTFDAYCQREIGILPLTAKKLLRSYAFLEQHEPKLLPAAEDAEEAGDASASVARFPSYEAVDVLRQAKEQANVPEPAYRQLREQIFDEGQDAPAARKELRLVIRRSQPPEQAEAAEAQARGATLRRLVGTLRQIGRQAAQERMLPAALQRQLEQLIERLEATAAETSRQ